MNRLIAVAVKKDGSVSPHAGRALDWQVYVVTEHEPTPQHCWDIRLTESGCLHEWHVREDGNNHPLHGVHVAIAASGGDGVRRRLAERNTVLLDCAETDPIAAVSDYLKGNLQPGAGHAEMDCLNPAHRASMTAHADETGS